LCIFSVGRCSIPSEPPFAARFRLINIGASEGIAPHVPWRVLEPAKAGSGSERPEAFVNGRDDFFVRHMVAVMLVDKTASFAAAHDKPRMQDPAILRERAKVRLIGDDELQLLLPRREAIVELTLTDGTQLTERVQAVRGTTENPMTREEVVTKCRDLMAPVLGAATSNTLIEKLLALETLKNIRELRPLLQRN